MSAFRLACCMTVLFVAGAITASRSAMGDGAGNPAIPKFKGKVPMLQALEARRSTKTRDPTVQYFIDQSPLGDPRTRAVCYSLGRCFLARLTCPWQCPNRRRSSAHGTACFIDCNPSKCQTSCRSRKPNCHGYGALCYDPRFVGGDGVMFYFHGKAQQSFALVSDNDLHINARFIGTRPEGRKRDFTWVEALGITYNNDDSNSNNQLSIGVAKRGPWEAGVDRLAIAHNGKQVHLPVGESSVWQTLSGDVKIERTDDMNSANIVVDGLVEVDVSVVPITDADNKIHNYKVDLARDCFAHLEIRFKFLGLSTSVDGVLGQTYRPDFKNPVKVGVPMPIMGGEDKFSTSSLFDVDCKACRFGAQKVTKDEGLGQQSIQCSTMGGGVICKR